jgi:tRNA (adenine37-N6)-methyltransferase
MSQSDDIRQGEIAVAAPAATDAGIVFIGRIHTPWDDRKECPRRGSPDGPECRIEIFEPWVAALDGLEKYQQIEVLYWLHKSRRDLIKQSPKNNGVLHGTFSLRSPVRPNPIGTQMVRLVKIEGPNVFVRGLDCLNGTPLIDLKPDRCAYVPVAPPKPSAEG